jgi:uncharacterized membrane protein
MDFQTGETHAEFSVLNENGTAAGYPTDEGRRPSST